MVIGIFCNKPKTFNGLDQLHRDTGLAGGSAGV
jgi:hypothetical protein